MFTVLPLDQISPDPNQPRQEMESPDDAVEARTLAGLADSIKSIGVLQPIRVQELEKNQYQIISGERRYKAAGMAGLAEIPVLIVKPAEVLVEQIVENLQRKAMTALELSEAVHVLVDQGLSNQQIGKKLGMSPSKLSILMHLKTVSEPIKLALNKKLIVSPRAAYDLNKLPIAVQQDLIRQAEQERKTLSQDDIRKARLLKTPDVPRFAPPLLSPREQLLLASVNKSPAKITYDPNTDRQKLTQSNTSKSGTTSLSYNQWFQMHLQEGKTQLEERIRVPAFTLSEAELKQLAKHLKTTVPESLADPGSWFIDLLKQLGKTRKIGVKLD